MAQNLLELVFGEEEKIHHLRDRDTDWLSVAYNATLTVDVHNLHAGELQKVPPFRAVSLVVVDVLLTQELRELVIEEFVLHMILVELAELKRTHVH